MNPSFDFEKIQEAIINGDPKALTELSEFIDNIDEEDEEAEELASTLLEKFDLLSVLYAMGDREDSKNEWPAFELIMKVYGQLEELREMVEKTQGLQRTVEFDLNVFKAMKKGAKGETLKRIEHAEEDAKQSLAEFAKQEEEAKHQVQFQEEWLKTAKNLLKNPRFANLSEDMFIELIEAVSSEMAQMHQGSEDMYDDDDSCDEGSCCEPTEGCEAEDCCKK